MGHSLHFNDVDLSDYGLVVLRGPRPAVADARIGTLPLVGADGAVARPSVWAERVLSVPCLVLATTGTLLQTYLDGIATALNEREDCELWFDYLNGRHWNARLAGGASAEEIAVRGARLDLAFLATDPHAYARGDESTAEDTIASGVATSDTSVVTTSGGSDCAWPDIEVVASGASSAVAVANEDNDQKALWASPGTSSNLAAGDTIRFRCARAHWVVDIKRSGDTDYYASMTGFEGRFPSLAPNTANTLTFWGVAGALTVRWRETYL